MNLGPISPLRFMTNALLVSPSALGNMEL